ncbi:HAD-IIB family hydrolase [Parasulfuritortus cantonensis]|uniref:HAD-IIB family hydrolase n=1 Tax=Parasulfuritortus cantonensis TaxID=2528202 RepID=UPI001F116A6B|nr:HAD-IIB family hydrolase [Parasulfuritortus cantonensis]
MLSIHGLIRSHDLELGRDADTGGQTLYVVELARALAACPGVARVDLVTRRVLDGQVSPDYSAPVEPLAGNARIVRIDAGPEGYLAKESLWDHLDSFADNTLSFLRAEGRLPDLVHSHYADAGYVGKRLAAQLGVPLVHTGHSLGRVKRRRLFAAGLKHDVIEARYQMGRRVEAEEDTLAAAELVIASTADEVEEQYGLYDHYQPGQMRVIPPGVDLARFKPPDGGERAEPIAGEVARFLREPDKPLVLAISRPDERKNIATLVQAYGSSAELQEKANLVVVAGNRDDVRDLDGGAQAVLGNLLLDIDRYDLYGRIAYPKHHRRDEVPVLYRLAASSGGVFINPALTEPFGLTLIEAAASGLPIVATADGGPRDIVANCRNGYLVDPLDGDAIVAALLEVIDDPDSRRRLAQQGLEGVQRHYSWTAHAEAYLAAVRPLLEGGTAPAHPVLRRRPRLYHDRAIFTDLDQNLLGDPASLADFVRVVRANRKCASFGIVTGRSLESALKVMRRHGIPMPDVLISSLGTAIHYAPEYQEDKAWSRHIDHLWTPRAVRAVLDELPGLKRQGKEEQTGFKVSYFIDPQVAPPLETINSLLHQAEQTVNVSLAFGQFLDVTPVRASKGMALRWFTHQWGIPLEHVLAAGGSGADEDMMRGNTLAVVVANRHHEELSKLADVERIYFAQAGYARGILEAIEHYDFYGSCNVPGADGR